MKTNEYKEVYFASYCKKCVNFKKDEDDDPCDKCLDEFVNLYSHKPVYFEEE